MSKTRNSVEMNLTCNHIFGREPILSKQNNDTVYHSIYCGYAIHRGYYTVHGAKILFTSVQGVK